MLSELLSFRYEDLRLISLMLLNLIIKRETLLWRSDVRDTRSSIKEEPN